MRRGGLSGWAAILVLAACGGWGLAATAQPAARVPERVTFASLDRDAAGVPVTITAQYFRPDVAPGTRVPLVVALHGCGGMFSTLASRQDRLSQRFAAWTDTLVRDGYAVLWPDSFTPRGRREICTVRNNERTVNAATRRLDELGALAYAATLPGVDPKRIALMGWSHGGSTTLATIDTGDRRVAAFRADPGSPAYFAAAVAFYPGCAGPLRQGARWKTDVPTAIHIGASDDWTPAAACVDLGYAAAQRKLPLTVTVYPDSYHGFDGPDGKVVLLADIPNGVNPGQGVHNGPNPAARAAANDAVREFLREKLASPR